MFARSYEGAGITGYSETKVDPNTTESSDPDITDINTIEELQRAFQEKVAAARVQHVLGLLSRSPTRRTIYYNYGATCTGVVSAHSILTTQLLQSF